MSLSEQLQKLQLPGQSVIQQLSAKKVSILFDCNTVAGLDNEAILNIGISGYEELLSIDSVFAHYEHFFSKDSLTFQRNLIGKKENFNLKEKISSYLIYLSPYLQLKAAQKTLEWLLRRYQIHIFDKDSLMMCILPYHETNLFARIIQVFGKRESNDMWDWLISCQTEGVGFNTQSLIKQCAHIRNRNLLSFIFKMVEEANKKLELKPKSELKMFFSFFARTVTCVIETYDTLSEEFISYLLPLIHTGLKSKTKDFVTSAYMIIAMVCCKTQLSKDICKALQATIIKSMEPSWYEEGLLCFLTILLNQKVKRLSPRVFNLLLSLQLNSLLNEIIALNLRVDLSQLFYLLLPLLCENCVNNENCVVMLDRLIDELQLNGNQTNSLIKKMIESTIKLLKKQEDTTEAQNILKKLSTRHVLHFDNNIAKLFSKFEENNSAEDIDALKKLVSQCLSTSKHQMVVESELPLVISLNHPESGIRCYAVHQLFKTLKEDIHDFSDEYLKVSITARLNDDSNDVVMATLKYSNQITSILPVNDILVILESLIANTEQHFNLNELLVFTLQNMDFKNVSTATESFICGFFIRIMHAFAGKKNKKVLEAFKNVSISSEHPILQGIFKTLDEADMSFFTKSKLPSDTVVEIYNQLLTNIAECMVNNENGTDILLNKFWSYKVKLPFDHDMHLVGILLLRKVIKKTGCFGDMDLSMYSKLQCNYETEDLKEKLEYLENTTEESEQVILKEYYNLLKGKSTDITSIIHFGYISFLKDVITEVSNTKDQSVKVAVFQLLCEQAVFMKFDVNFAQVLIKLFFKECFKKKKDVVIFLCEICINIFKMADQSPKQHIYALTALQMLSKLLVEEKDFKIISMCDVLIATYISLLSSSVAILRKIAIENVQLIFDITENETKYRWNFVLEKLVQSKQEIILDGNQIKSILKNVFTIKTDRRKSEFSGLKSASKSKSKKTSAKQLDSFKLFMEVIRASKSSAVQMKLMQMLEFVNIELLWKECIEFLNELICIDEMSVETVKTVLLVLKHMKDDSFETYEGEIVDVFQLCLNQSTSESIQNACFDMVSSPFYDFQSVSAKQEILKSLMNILLASQSVLKSTKVRTMLKQIHLPGEYACYVLHKFNKEFDDSFKQNPDLINNVDVLLNSSMLRNVTEILETVNTNKKCSGTEEITVALFSTFERILKLTDQTFEYHRQLCLTTLLSLMSLDISSTFPTDSFKSNLVVLCLQQSKDTTTNQLCLQVLSRAAVLYPTQVLHNIMHVFTFMGGNMLRIDNQHTFKVIEQTIDSIIPVLIKKEKHEEEENRKRPLHDSTKSVVFFILQTFIDSIPHCPEHRQQHILLYLLKVMGTGSYLHIAMILLLKKIIELADKRSKNDFDELEVAPVTLEFCQSLFASCPVSLQIVSLNKIFFYLKSVSEEEGETSAKKKKIEGKDPLDITTLGEKDFKLLQFTTVSFAIKALQNENVCYVYSDLPTSQINNVTKCILRLLEELLNYTEVVVRVKDLRTNSEKTKTFWNHLISKVHYLISHVYSLLPFNSFVEVVNGLLDKDSHLIQKKSLELLYEKLSKITELEEHQEPVLLQLFDKLISLVQHKENEEKERAVNKQFMLLLIKVLAILLCNKYEDRFVNSIPVIVQLYSTNDSDELVAINAMLCIAELSGYIKAGMLPYLPIFMKPLLAKIKNVEEEEEVVASKVNEVLFTSFVATIQKLLVAIPQFLSQYLHDILMKVSYCEYVGRLNHYTSLCNDIKEVQSCVGELIPPRVLYPTIENVFDQLVTKNLTQATFVINVFKKSFDTISKADANKNYNTNILSIIKKALVLRSSVSHHKLQNVIQLEDVAIQSFCVLVMKLSENTLRPMYLELFKWATKENEGDLCRMVSFYRLSVKLSTGLKSLYLLFVGQILPNAAKLLTQFNSTEEKRDEKETVCELLCSVVETLKNCFHYDNQGFIKKDKFDLLMEPLVNQLDNNLFDKSYISFIDDHLLQCLVSFASAVNDVGCWKSLNHQILLKTKSPCDQVRLGSLKITYEIYHRMGESYMILIPETIPFLAEILEDDSAEVEQQCQKVIKLIEDITGESLQKYF